MTQPEYAATTLHDGRTVDTGSEEWKIECLAKYVLQRGTRGQIEEWLRQFAAKKDPAVVQQLRERMSAIKQARIVSDAKRQEKATETVATVTEATNPVADSGGNL
jgi:hypothetical protein